MNVEYPLINTNTIAVGEQAAEGDTLDYGKLTLTSATAPIKTYGGYTDMSRQVVERSSINYVDTAFRAMVAKYASATNAAAIAKITAVQNTFNQTNLASFDTDDILEALADSASEVNQNTGLPLQVLLVGKTVFKSLAKAVDGSNRPLLSNVGATQNTFGSINPIGLTGNILGLPVVFDPALNTNAMFAMNSAALSTYESSGAPFRLNDEEITGLTNSFSVYGYLALTCQEPLAATRFGGVVGY
jgi:HK97 family phage major capsid protein